MYRKRGGKHKLGYIEAGSYRFDITQKPSLTHDNRSLAADVNAFRKVERRSSLLRDKSLSLEAMAEYGDKTVMVRWHADKTKPREYEVRGVESNRLLVSVYKDTTIRYFDIADIYVLEKFNSKGVVIQMEFWPSNRTEFSNIWDLVPDLNKELESILDTHQISSNPDEWTDGERMIIRLALP